MKTNLMSGDWWEKVFLDYALDGVLIVQADNLQIVAANSLALLMLKAPIESVLGQRYLKFIDAKPLESYLTNTFENPPDYVECSLTTEEGQKFPIITKSIRTSFDHTDYFIMEFIGIAHIKTSSLFENEHKMLAEALRETTFAINQSLNIHDVLDLILSNVGKVVSNDAANIMLVNDGLASMVACRGYEMRGSIELVMQQVRAISEVPNLRYMAETGQPIVVPNTLLSKNWIAFNTSAWIRSYVSAPILHKGEIIGFLNLNSATPDFFQPPHAERLLAFANQAAIAIENARLFESAQKEISERKLAEAALQESKYELEVRVEQRTMQLRQANEQLTQELTRRQQVEATLERERAQLALRVEERTAELSAANGELAKAAQMKDAFLASMSHELRTPLNAILNISETLEEQVFGDLNEMQRKSVRTIEEGGRHLLSLINDILDLSKIGAGKIELIWDNVPVEAICQASLKFVEEMARKKNIIISSTFDYKVKTIRADQRRLKQILVNLLSNAVKFTPQGGSVGLAVVGDPEKKQAKFVVWDSGIGISEEGIKNLFKPFVQLDNQLDRHYEGTGLGLALVYSLVELHGGGIHISSEEGKGSDFTVTLNWTGEMTGTINQSSFFGESGEDPSDPFLRIENYLGELGVESEHYWVEPESGDTQSEFPHDFDLYVVDLKLFQAREDIQNPTRYAADFQNRPVILVAQDDPGTGFDPMTHSIGILKYPFNRRELRTVIKQISPNGTARLMHHILIIQEKKPMRSGDGPVILIAEDNETTLKVLSDYLQTKGYHILSAHNGIEAVEQVRTNPPDLVLMDILMPGMDGLEAIRQIRSEGQAQNVPIIALTALAMAGDRARCLEAGANDYISKPVGLSDLVKTIKLLIQK